MGKLADRDIYAWLVAGHGGEHIRVAEMIEMTRHTKLLILGRRQLADDYGQIGGLEVVGVAGAVDEALSQLELGCDLVLLDFDMPGADGLERLDRLRAIRPDLLVIAVVEEQDPALMAKAMLKGAAGFLPRYASAKEITDAIQVVRAGGSYIDPLQTQLMIDKLRDGRLGTRFDDEVSLSTRETEVLVLLAEGLSARQIATRLGLSERTVNTHVANVYRKLGVSNRVEAVREAIRMGLVDDTD